MHSISQSIKSIRNRIADAEERYRRSAQSVGLLAVSKTRPAEELREAYRAGQQRFGESYLQEALKKIAALDDLDIEWHFIGPLQSNKTRAIAEHFDWVHSIDRLKLARRLSEQRPKGMPPLNICIQINVSGEASKSGIPPSAVMELALGINELPGLRLRGLMCIPASSTNFEQQRVPFRKLREIADESRVQGLSLDTLSAGMTADMEAAIAEGSTIVRVGTGIFGPRPK
ncbi:MAG: YggS family pyridoxal phosphate-dependent enzyme, partial [Proteobacteria bacterium]|nr:YggS family pyridoxal phosphate-dependent enzyme [Pseudomonadota bacterium]